MYVVEKNKWLRLILKTETGSEMLHFLLLYAVEESKLNSLFCGTFLEVINGQNPPTVTWQR